MSPPPPNSTLFPYTTLFRSVEEVETLIDRASRVKLNVLHLHLSDDQGWRITIDGGADTTSGIDYSRLTSISGDTAMTEDSEGNPMGTEPGRTGFYTKADYRRIVAYATSRGMTVVPEIDVPGHTNAALHAIPELNSEGRSEEHTSELQSRGHLVCRLLLEKKKKEKHA